MKTIPSIPPAGHSELPETGLQITGSLQTIANFFDCHSLPAARELLWELFSAALSGEDESFTGRRAGGWACFYRQLDRLLEAAELLNSTCGPETELVAVGVSSNQSYVPGK